MTPLVLVAALGAFVHPHSSRDVRPAIVTRRVEPPPAAHPVREFVGRCVDPEVPAPTSDLAEAVIIIGVFLLQALFCPCCRMVLAMPAKVASTVASAVLGRLRGGATDEALLHLAKTVIGFFLLSLLALGSSRFLFWIGFSLLFFADVLMEMPGKVASTVASTVLGRLRGGATDEALLHLAKTVRLCAVVGLFCAVYRVVGEDAIARFWNEHGFLLGMTFILTIPAWARFV